VESRKSTRLRGRVSEERPVNEKIFFDALFVGSQQQQQRKIDKHKYTIKFEFARQSSSVRDRKMKKN